MLSSFDFVTIILSLSLVIWAVLRAAGKKSSGSEYFLAGRDLRWQFIGMSLLASNISAEHVIGLAGDGYRVGLVVGGFEWVGASDLICLAAFFAPLYLRENLHDSGVPRAPLRMEYAGLPLRELAGHECSDQECH